MTVFVDDMYLYPMGNFRGMHMSHMIASTDEELHAMAAAIGIARRWYQGDHYDVAMTKRTAAIKLGAVPVTMRQLGILTILRRRTGRVPSDAVAAEQLWKIHIWSQGCR
jgi:DNA-binding response OmpR family regulator